MKVETINLNNLTMNDIQKQQHRVKVILLNSKVDKDFLFTKRPPKHKIQSAYIL